VIVSLSLAGVPAALMLALLAAVFDFVPVLGLLCAGVPAVLLALTRSATLAALVVVLYLGYHAIENYFLAPRIYGNRLRLSHTAVLLSFAAGAMLAGVVGAIVALPLAATYPCIEQIWFEARLEDVAEEHQQIARRREIA
jgi:predicted PurR-regulated permease PerM